MIKNYRYLTKDTKMLVLYYGVENVGSAMGSFITVFYVISLGYGLIFYGVLTAVGGISFVAFLLPMSSSYTLLGSKRSVMIGTVLQAASDIMIGVSTERATILSSAVVWSLGASMISPNFGALISKSENIDMRTHGFSASGFMSQIGAFAGTAASGIVSSLLYPFVGRVNAYRLVFVISATIILFSVSPAMLSGVNIRGSRPKFREQSYGIIYRLMIPALLIGAGAGFLIPYFPVQFKERFGASVQLISLIFSLTSLFMAFFMLYMPYIERNRGSLRSIVSSWMLSTVFMIAMPLTDIFGSMALPLFSTFYFFRTVIMNAISPVQSSFELSLLKEQYRPIASSLETLAWNAANSGTVVLGAIVMKYSLNLPFYICAAFYISASVLYYRFFRHFRPA
jgi:MFS family permease